MCFTPAISLTTAIIEFILAILILLLFKRTIITRFSALFITVLGAYQFSEFMLCTSNNIQTWVILGFIIYTFLPAIGLHAIIKFLKLKTKKWLVYTPPIIFSLIALLYRSFIIEGNCSKYFVKVKTIFFLPEIGLKLFPTLLYWIYYFGFILIFCILAYNLYKKERNKKKRRIYSIELAAVFVMVIPTFIFIMVLPSFGIMFPSILCEFALLLAILAFIGAYIENKKN